MLILLLLFLLSLGLALAIVRGVAPLSTIELARKEKKVCLTLCWLFTVIQISCRFTQDLKRVAQNPKTLVWKHFSYVWSNAIKPLFWSFEVLKCFILKPLCHTPSLVNCFQCIQKHVFFCICWAKFFCFLVGGYPESPSSWPRSW